MSELVILNDGILAARAGEDAVDVAVREHARLVYRICYCVLRNHQDAEDAVHGAAPPPVARCMTACSLNRSRGRVPARRP